MDSGKNRRNATTAHDLPVLTHLQAISTENAKTITLGTYAFDFGTGAAVSYYMSFLGTWYVRACVRPYASRRSFHNSLTRASV